MKTNVMGFQVLLFSNTVRDTNYNYPLRTKDIYLNIMIRSHAMHHVKS